jgi:hypothetical protein
MSTNKSTKSQKKGGALADDVANLAVPFAILLAKYGLDKFYDKKEKKVTEKSKKKPSTAAKLPRRKSIAGGDCSTGACSKKGGNLANVSKQIDDFLNKK